MSSSRDNKVAKTPAIDITPNNTILQSAPAKLTTNQAPSSSNTLKIKSHSFQPSFFVGHPRGHQLEKEAKECLLKGKVQECLLEKAKDSTPVEDNLKPQTTEETFTTKEKKIKSGEERPSLKHFAVFGYGDLEEQKSTTSSAPSFQNEISLCIAPNARK